MSLALGSTCSVCLARGARCEATAAVYVCVFGS
mgnify:CR=1 FL=1